MNVANVDKTAPWRGPGAAGEVPLAVAQDPGRSLRILMVCTRDPRGRMSGRKMVLRTVVDSLTALGHKVTLCHFGSSSGPGPDPNDGAVYLRLPLPTALELLVNGVLALALGRRAINEALYDSSRAHRIVADLVAWNGYDLVITDMVRTAGYGARSGLPWIADLDDLLSERYGYLAGAGKRTDNLFGYHSAPLIRRLVQVARQVQPLILRRESRILARREAAVARLADLTTLVSEAEAAALAARSGRPVTDTPMAVAGPARAPDERRRAREAVFLGGLDYGPNLVALRQFDGQVIPALRARGIGDFTLDVIGTATAQQAAALSGAIRVRGYIDDLDTALQGYETLVVPAVTPGGVKTKIIVAALNGTLVLAHASALEGMGLTPGTNVLAWEGAEDLARILAALREGRIDRAPIARAARNWALARYAPEVLRERWRRNVAACLASAQTKPRLRKGPMLTRALSKESA
ncbi:glycosyltransferase family protein [Acidimangrovimonas sediminis]|uniref:glycosyltransferase n=1 Tax=Acidimangrovimonas sediminis TaxID=2056283 RepID=UPI000C7FE9CC|nr:glycosyltransferase [Acidimangrovimonas sediminis]